MKHRHAGARLGSVIAGIVIAASCGGQAVIDPPLGGSGGSGASGGGGAGGGGLGGEAQTGGAGGTNDACNTGLPMGEVFGCSGVVSAVAGGGFYCESYACDEGGNTWTSACTEEGCDCLFNGAFICQCESDGAGCGFEQSCCPPPFP